VELKPETVRAFEQYVRDTEAGLKRCALPATRDSIGAVLVPGVTLKRTLALVQDYDHNQDNYEPEVLVSLQVSRDGNDFKLRCVIPCGFS
jgi:hypothetical protein